MSSTWRSRLGGDRHAVQCRADHTDQFARPVSWQELIYIFFRYAMHGNETLPAEFVEALERRSRTLSAGPRAATDRGRRSITCSARSARATSDANCADDDLHARGHAELPEGRGEGLLRLLDEIVRLNQIGRPSLADAALHARYHLYERSAVHRAHSATEWRAQGARELLEISRRARTTAALEQQIVDASPHIVYELLEAWPDRRRPSRARSGALRPAPRSRPRARARTVRAGADGDVSSFVPTGWTRS